MELPKYFYFRLYPTKKGTAVEIEDASDADVVEIIRCRDCKYWGMSWQPDCAPNYRYCANVDGKRKDDFYCADAERRTDE